MAVRSAERGAESLPGSRDGASSTGLSASFVWDQFENGYQIELWGPLGQGRTRLIGDGAALTIITSRGETLAREDAESLMVRALGWSVPIDVLPEWIQGRTASATPVLEEVRDGEARLASFRQLGWSIELSRYRDVSGTALPGRLVARRGGHKITIICREWLLH